MTATVYKGDVAFEGAVDLSDADVTNPDALSVSADHTWTGANTFNGAVVLTGATVSYPAAQINPAALTAGRRTLAADAALTLGATDRSVELNITTGTTVATMTATHAGHRVRVYAGIRSGGAYTLACTRGA